MPMSRGDILDHGAEVEPVLRSTHVTVRADFVHRAMRRRFRTPLKQQHPRGFVVHAPSQQSRHAIMKVWQPSPKTTAQHLSYLTHEGTDGPGRKAELFTDEGKIFDRRSFVKAACDETIKKLGVTHPSGVECASQLV